MIEARTSASPMAPFSLQGVPAGQSKVPYGLYGVVEHSGTMRGGHYTAYVKVRTPSNKLHDLISDGLACPGEHETFNC